MNYQPQKAPRLHHGHSLLSDDLREFAASLGRIIMPAAHGMPGFDQSSLARFEAHLDALGPELARSFLTPLYVMKWRARIFGSEMDHRKEQRLARLVKKLETSHTLDRQLLRTVSVVLKLSHYDCESVYQAAKTDYIRRKVASDEHHKRQGIIDLTQLMDLGEVTIDAIVVGSGAGGAVIAYELADAGYTVLIIEEGRYHGRSSFTHSSNQASRDLYRNRGAIVTLGNPPIYLPVGRTVGGTTTINSGTCYRPPERVLAKWQKMGLEQWGSEDLAPHLDKVEQILRVERAKPEYLGGIADVIALGCDRLGYDHQPLQRNAPECDGQGVCAFGCPTDAKLSTNVSYIPLALRHGAYLSPGTSLKRILTQHDRVKGVLVEHLDSHTLIELRCNLLVLSTGTLRTPLLLKDMGLRNRHLGRNLTIHPAASVVAEFDRPIKGDRAIPQGYAIESFHDQGILFEGAFVPLEVMAASTFLHGEKLQQMMSGYAQLANFGFMIEDQGRGRVLGERGDFPLVAYSLTRADTRKIHKGMEILAGVFLAAGATCVRPQLQDDIEIRSWRDLRVFASRPLPRSRLDLSAYHPLGTARLGKDPSTGVVDPTGKVFGLRNLFVADGSIIPTSPAVNPQITIMAAATYIATMLKQAKTLT